MYYNYCIACGSKQIINDFFKSSSLKINVCQNCGLGWGATYPNSDGYFSWSESIYKESMLRSKMYTDRIKRIHKKINPFPKIWLDVGCAEGKEVVVRTDLRDVLFVIAKLN